jgi:hypothetical protein
MKKIAVVTNWILLALFGVAFITLLVRSPGQGGFGSLLPLLPYATALLALKSAPSRALSGIGILFNALLIVVGLVGLVAAVTDMAAQPLVAGLASVVFILPSALNCLLLKWSWDRACAMAQSANKRLQATRRFLRFGGHPDLTVRSVRDAKTRT